MKIEYENKFRDILLFNAVHQFFSPILQGFFLLFSIYIIFSEIIYWRSGVISAFLWGVIFYFGIWTFQFIFNALYLFSKKDISILTEHIVEIQNDAFYEETKYNRSYFYWNGINKVVRYPGFVAVYISKHMAHIIPKRAFSSEDQIELFINTCKDKLKSV